MHSQIVGQAQEMESKEKWHNDKTLQEIKSQLIKRGKHLSNCYRQQKRILFQIKENKIIWFFKWRDIVSLLEQYNRGSQDKIEANF